MADPLMLRLVVLALLATAPPLAAARKSKKAKAAKAARAPARPAPAEMARLQGVLEEAERLLEAGDKPAAVERFQAAVTLRPDFEMAHFNLAGTLQVGIAPVSHRRKSVTAAEQTAAISMRNSHIGGVCVCAGATAQRRSLPPLPGDAVAAAAG